MSKDVSDQVHQERGTVVREPAGAGAAVDADASEGGVKGDEGDLKEGHVKRQGRWQSGPVPIGRGGGRSPRYRHGQPSHHGGGSYGSGGLGQRGGGRGGYQSTPRGGPRRHSGGLGESPPFRGNRGGHQSPRTGGFSPSGGHSGGNLAHHHASRFSSSTATSTNAPNVPHHGTSPQSNGGLVRPTPPPPPPTKNASSPLVVTDGWQYKDPEDDIHGPYLASKIVNWVDKGYFSEGLPVRKVTKEGMGAWTTLKFVLIDMRREAALTIIPKEQSEETVAVVAEASTTAASVDASLAVETEDTGAKTQQSPATVKKPPPPPAKVPLNSPGGQEKDMGHTSKHLREDTGRSRDSPVGKWERDSRGPRSRLGGDRWGAAPDDRNQSRTQRGGRVDRNMRNDVKGRGQRPDRGGRSKGRGGRGGGRGRGSSTDPDLADAVRKLFTGDVDQGAEQPMWRYIDYEGATQGPFPAKTMIEWFEGGYLTDSAILVCGTERKVSPPNLPPPDFYMPLGALIYWVRRGHTFKSITVTDIQSKNLPEELATLKESAAKAFEVVNKEKETAENTAAAKKSVPATGKGSTPSSLSKADERPAGAVRSEISWAEAEEMDLLAFGDSSTHQDISSATKELDHSNAATIVTSLEQASIKDKGNVSKDEDINEDS